jgi:23S rRNA pseudouridine2605 synthase
MSKPKSPAGNKSTSGETAPDQSERVQKALARMGYGSRREIERLVEQGEVRINGQPAKLGDHVSPGDKINIGTRRTVIRKDVKRVRVLIYNKPEGEVCTRKDEQGRPTVFDSIGSISDGRWIVIGRLDINSQGLLLFTNYGELANYMMHPSSEIEREYAARVNGEVTPDMIRRMLKGVDVDGELLRFDQVMDVGGDAGGKAANHWYHVILREGKNREVRRLWESQGMRVSRLIRVRYGSIVLPRNLRTGKKHELTLDEVKQLFGDIGLDLPKLVDDNEKRRVSRHKKASRNRRFGGAKTGHKTDLRKRPKSLQSKRSTSKQ